MKSVISYLTERTISSKKHEFNTNPQDIEEMVRASTKGNLPLLKEYILDKHVDVNAKNSWNSRALNRAVQNNDTTIIKFLLEQGADATYIISSDLKDVRETTFDLIKQDLRKEVIYEAFWNFQKEGFNYHIIKNNIHLLTKEEISELFYVACSITIEFSKEICDFYLEQGADINHKSENGNFSALYACIKKEFVGAVEYLISKGADLTTKVSFGKSPMDLLKVTKNPKLKELFNGLNERTISSKTVDYKLGDEIEPNVFVFSVSSDEVLVAVINNSKFYDYHEAVEYLESMGKDWRLPTLQEAKEIKNVLFKVLHASRRYMIWTSSKDGNAMYAYDLNDGYEASYTKGTEGMIRVVGVKAI